ncbi:MAG TPA: GcrA family cell cycle regulator [Xanthobacteraceae bacterium]|jgi:GcrA cell cycle regulator
MSWTDERVELLKKLWSDGLSASRIATELGGMTRNAVIGKVHRLGLSGRAKSAANSAARPRKARSPTHMLRLARPSIRGNTALAHAYDIETEAEPEPIDNIIPIGQRRSILELTAQTCRWPVGDPGSGDFFFCGGHTLAGLPYCAYHARVAYHSRIAAEPLADRRRDKRSPR